MGASTPLTYALLVATIAYKKLVDASDRDIIEGDNAYSHRYYVGESHNTHDDRTYLPSQMYRFALFSLRPEQVEEERCSEYSGHCYTDKDVVGCDSDEVVVVHHHEIV